MAFFIPRVGAIVHYYNPNYAPEDNEHTGEGPYAAIVTRAWDAGETLYCNLAIITPGKETVAQVGTVPYFRHKGAEQAPEYPRWCWPEQSE